MFTHSTRFTRSIRRCATVSLVVAVSTVAPGTSPAGAGPKPLPGSSQSSQSSQSTCPLDVKEFAAFLRSRGFTAQAANVAAALTVRSCRS